MRETGIIFAGGSVLQILAGHKTQTRRILEPPPELGDDTIWRPDRCRYGERGDRLWVKENLYDRDQDGWSYAVDHGHVLVEERDFPAAISWAHHRERDTCPAMFMPKWASRITLEIEDIRNERLQSITEFEARMEGVDATEADPFMWCGCDSPPSHASTCRWSDPTYRPTAVLEYARAWDKINGKRERGRYQWSHNPFVLVLCFKRIA